MQGATSGEIYRRLWRPLRGAGLTSATHRKMGADAAVAKSASPHWIDVSIASDAVWRVQSRLSQTLAKRSHWQLLYRMKRATVRSAMLLQSKLSERDANPGRTDGHDTSLYVSMLK
jgi:hypothetical protein